MKKTLLSLVMAFAILPLAFGQTRELQIWRDGSIVQSFTVAGIDSITISSDTTIDGHDYVDLGLPSGTLWATCNVGATNPEDYGDYYAWGETTTKSDYSESTYTYSGNPTELPTSADVAYVTWGSNWRMPSLAQFQELSSYTTTTWTTLNGFYGWLITSKLNGTSIFLPAAWYRRGSSLNDGVRAATTGRARSARAIRATPTSCTSIRAISSRPATTASPASRFALCASQNKPPPGLPHNGEEYHIKI